MINDLLLILIEFVGGKKKGTAAGHFRFPRRFSHPVAELRRQYVAPSTARIFSLVRRKV